MGIPWLQASTLKYFVMAVAGLADDKNRTVQASAAFTE